MTCKYRGQLFSCTQNVEGDDELEDVAFGSWTSEMYIKERHDQYQKWYDGKAVQCKSRYLKMRAMSVVGGAMVPVLINMDIPYMTAVTTILSLIVVVLVSLETVYHFREQWKNYRSTEQYIVRELMFFRTSEGLYKELEPREAFLLFVERVENAIATENTATLNVMTLAPQAEKREGTR